MDNEGHAFDWDNTSIIAQAKQRHARELLEAWYSKRNSIKHIELDQVYKSLRNRTGSELATHLDKLFQCSYNTGIYPTMWKIAQVHTVHEKQDKSNPANYLPISPFSIISKVMEGVISIAIK
eukprot:g34960.t1